MCFVNCDFVQCFTKIFTKNERKVMPTYVIICHKTENTFCHSESNKCQEWLKIKENRGFVVMIKVLFVCHGNICRSPMAEFVMKDIVNRAGLSDQFYISSAAASTEEIGNGIHHGTARILREMQIPCSGHRAIQMTKGDYKYYDYLIGMDDANIRNMTRIAGGDKDGKIFSLLSFAGKSRAIADPWYTGDFDTTFEDVKEGCGAFFQYLQSK